MTSEPSGESVPLAVRVMGLVQQGLVEFSKTRFATWPWDGLEWERTILCHPTASPLVTAVVQSLGATNHFTVRASTSCGRDDVHLLGDTTLGPPIDLSLHEVQAHIGGDADSTPLR